jgi:hypothetical protein
MPGVHGRVHSGANLLPVDRSAWSDAQGRGKARRQMPPGMALVIEKVAGKTDPDGWIYSTNFGSSKWLPKPEGGVIKQSWVRRRRWKVRCVRARAHAAQGLRVP